MSAIPLMLPGSLTAPAAASCITTPSSYTVVAADGGDRQATQTLVTLLAERGDLDELRDRADAGDRFAASRLADLLTERDLDELRDRADAGDRFAAMRLADLLAERGPGRAARPGRRRRPVRRLAVG